jgi:hypothetical protein
MSENSAETPGADSSTADSAVPQSSSGAAPDANRSGSNRSIGKWIALTVVVVLVAAGGTIMAIGVDSIADQIAPKLVEVTGKVKFNGQPMTAGFVQTYYARKGYMGSLGPIGKDGEFKLLTNGDAGAYSGEHRMVVIWMDNSFPPKHLLPAKYTSPASTPLVIQVSRSGKNELEIELMDSQ